MEFLWRAIRWPVGLLAGLIVDQMLFLLLLLVWNPGVDGQPLTNALMTIVGACVAVLVIGRPRVAVGAIYAGVKLVATFALLFSISYGTPSVSEDTAVVGHFFRSRDVLLLLVSLPSGVIGACLAGLISPRPAVPAQTGMPDGADSQGSGTP